MTAPLRLFDADAESTSLRCGTRLDRYRLQGRLGEGGFATVYSAYDNVEKRRVAIKVPDSRYVSNTQTINDLRREVEIMRSLEHRGILRVLDARIIHGHFVMVFPLGQETLADRMLRRMSRATVMSFAYQMIEAVAFAHRREVLHRDIKPENFILFPHNEIRLTDFGLARLEQVPYDDSASGTLGYIAPEQALGKPAYHSDVFSLGLLIYRMLSGELPEYPFHAPLPGYNRLRRGLSRDFVALIRRSIDPTPSKRFRDATAMLRALRRIERPLSEKTSQQRFRDSVRRREYRAA